MPHPVKLSDLLVSAAREASALSHRSIGAQIEHWATLGRAIEGQLTAHDAAALSRSVQEARGVYDVETPVALGEQISVAIERSLQPEFSRSLRDRLAQSSRPTYGSHPDYPGQLVRREPDGRLTPGRMVGRQFIPSDPASAR